MATPAATPRVRGASSPAGGPPLNPPVVKPIGGENAEGDTTPPKDITVEVEKNIPKRVINRELQRDIFLALCGNVDGEELAKPGTTADQIKTIFQHLRGVSEIAAYEFGDGSRPQ